MKTVNLLGAMVLLSVLGFAAASAQIPRTLSYQGVITDSLGSPKPTGLYTMTFRLYSSATGGAPLWTEQKSLNVRQGLVSTVLGDVVAFGPSIRFDVPYWLGIQVESQPELLPRAPLGAPP